MSSRSSIEQWLQQLTDDILDSLVSYLVTFRLVLRNPRTELPHLISSEERYKEAMLPGPFLIVNILIVFAIRTIFGFPLPEFPLQFHWSVNLPIALLQYFLGLLVFSIFLLLLVSARDFPRGLNQIAPVICYASIVYIPLSIVDMEGSSAYGRFIFDLMTSVLHRHLSSIWSFSSIELLGLSFLFVVGVTWWLQLVHLGMKSVNLHLPYKGWKTLLSAFFCFFITKTGFLVLGSVLFFARSFTTELHWEELKRAISTSPPDCSAALKMADQISENDSFPVYHRYVAQIVSATCLPLAFLPDEVKAKRIMPAIVAIQKSKYEEAKGLIGEYLIELAKSKASGRQSLAKMARMHLEKADELHRSPQFIELKENWIISYNFPEAPIALFP